jgi:hypothetical protein
MTCPPEIACWADPAYAAAAADVRWLWFLWMLTTPRRNP